MELSQIQALVEHSQKEGKEAQYFMHTLQLAHSLIVASIPPAWLQDPRVLDAMLPYCVSLYGNPHSRTHAYGWEAEKAVEAARKVCTLSHCGYAVAGNVIWGIGL